MGRTSSSSSNHGRAFARFRNHGKSTIGEVGNELLDMGRGGNDCRRSEKARVHELTMWLVVTGIDSPKVGVTRS